MAEDQERADRIRQLKRDHPELKWQAIADHVGVSMRAAQAWQEKGAISYEKAKKLAELFPEADIDYVMRGISKQQQATPDLMGTLNGNRSQLDRIEAKLDDILSRLEEPPEDLEQALEPGDPPNGPPPGSTDVDAEPPAREDEAS